MCTSQLACQRERHKEYKEREDEWEDESHTHVLTAAISRMARCVREASAPRRENSLAECVSAGLLRFDYLVISGVSEAIFEDQRAVRFSAARRGPRAALAWHNQLMATNNSLQLPPLAGVASALSVMVDAALGCA